MFDIGISKLLIIGGLALVVVGPERLPRVARTMGTLIGRAQRYMAEVKAEVNRSMEVEELQRMRSEFRTATQDIQDHVAAGLHEVHAGVQSTWHDSPKPAVDAQPGAAYRPKKTKWRLKRSALPQWYKQRQRVRTHAQSGAARVARFRPSRPSGRRAG